jgi:hypothetical protein
VKTTSAKAALSALLAAKKARNGKPGARPAALATNTALSGQNRRVLAQHYRAKYGVK